MLRGTCSLVLVSMLVACGGDDGGGGGGDDDGSNGTADAHDFCVEETNRYRAMEGKPPVAPSAALQDYADEGAAYDHDRQPHDHFRDTSGGGIAFAENECPHWDLSFGNGDLNTLVANCLEAFYSEGPGGGHYENMMGNYAQLGCGIYARGTDYTIIQDYGP